MKRIVSVFPGERPLKDEEERAKQVQALLQFAYRTWRELGDQLLEWPDDIDALLRSYVAQHAADFISPSKQQAP